MILKVKNKYKRVFISFKYEVKGILYYENSNEIKLVWMLKEVIYIEDVLLNIKGYKQYDD